MIYKKIADLPSQPVNNPMTPDAFERIKNSLFNEYSLLDYGRFADVISASYQNVWRLMGEKCPTKNTKELDNHSKTALVFERLEIEPSPKRFIELCAAIAKHMRYVSTLPSTEKNIPDIYRQDIGGIFLAGIKAAFDDLGYGHMLVFGSIEKSELKRHKIKYAGNDFGAVESGAITTQGYNSETLLNVTRSSVKDSKRKFRLLRKIEITPELSFGFLSVRFRKRGNE